jgi:hypothetical protein
VNTNLLVKYNKPKQKSEEIENKAQVAEANKTQVTEAPEPENSSSYKRQKNKKNFEPRSDCGPVTRRRKTLNTENIQNIH